MDLPPKPTSQRRSEVGALRRRLRAHVRQLLRNCVRNVVGIDVSFVQHVFAVEQIVDDAEPFNLAQAATGRSGIKCGIFTMPVDHLVIPASVAPHSVLSPGPNIVYLASRSICQGPAAELVSSSAIVFAFPEPSRAASATPSKDSIRLIRRKRQRRRKEYCA
jgi:hypothetical protein